MKILGIEHVGIAFNDREKSSVFFNDILNLGQSNIENILDQKVLTEIFDTGKGKIELLEPTNSNSPISNFLSKKGNGIHHIALEVDKLDEWLDHLQKNNIKLIDNIPRRGAENFKIAFIHPENTGGILVELCQKY